MTVNKRRNAPPVEPDGPAYTAPALEKGLDILELLCRSDVPLTQKEISLRLGRTTSELYRMIACLVDRGYVAANDDRYVVTTKLFELAYRNPPMHRLLTEALPIMQRLSGEIDQSCHLTVYNQGRQIVIAKVDSPSGMGFSVRVGAELDVLVSASGRVLLAFQDSEIRAFRIEESVQHRPDHADQQIHVRLETIKARGFESSPSIQVRGLYAISYPVLDSGSHAIAALTVPYAERIDLVDRKPIQRIEELLQDAAMTLTRRIGGVLLSD
jgi:DNA-binding IclR family transcriptional regulator